MSLLNKKSAIEVSEALYDASNNCEDSDTAQSVVYIPSMDAAVSMPADPNPEQYGWKVITTVVPE
tara:strand:+ start:320 stop:514 length:195 start_codon:yes stop_codon:yes gene_type:complete